MRWYVIFLLSLFCLSACTYREKEEDLQKKEAILNQKEQELNSREKTLQLREEALQKREKSLDSNSKIDTLQIINPSLVGSWMVKMTCTETTCAGSAVGDTRNENWNLSYEANSLVAKAFFNNQLVRTYSGFYTGNTVELVENRDSAGTKVKMIVRLRTTDETHMEGQREITRDQCKVIYDLKLEKTNG